MTEPRSLFEIGSALVREPLARRFATKVEASGDNRVWCPDDVLGERLIRVGAFLLADTVAPGRLRLNVDDEHREEALRFFAASSLLATPYLWSEEVRTQLRSLEIPRHTLSPRLLPEPRMWFTFETGVNLGAGITTDFFLLWDYGEGMAVTIGGEKDESRDGVDDRQLNLHEGTGRAFLQTEKFAYGTVYPDDYPPDPDDPRITGRAGQLPSVLAMLAFLASPFIPKRRERASRPARREQARVGRFEAEDEVVFITLRRPDYERKENGEERAVDWKHRWIVSGHLRAQWYPSEQAHHLIWVAPYMKGPEGAPLIEHVMRVAR